MRAREPASFERIRESVVVAEKKLSSVRSFIILRSVERLTSFKKNNFA